MEAREADESDRTQLNCIAEQWVADGSFPAGTMMDDVTAICDSLHDEVEEPVATFATETPLTRREAEVWVLKSFIGRDSALLTDEAVALALTVPESPFGDARGTEDSADGGDVWTAATVAECFERAEEKYSQAETFVGTSTFWNRDECLETPRITWLDRVTVNRIKSRSRAEDATRDDVVTRLLDETETCLSLAELVRRYLDSRGRDNVAQVALHTPSPEAGMLMLSAHTGIRDELPDVIKDTDAITVNGEQYDFYFDEDPYGPHELGRVTLYAPDDDSGMDAVQLEDGIETVREQFHDATVEAEGDHQ